MNKLDSINLQPDAGTSAPGDASSPGRASSGRSTHRPLLAPKRAFIVAGLALAVAAPTLTMAATAVYADQAPAASQQAPATTSIPKELQKISEIDAQINKLGSSTNEIAGKIAEGKLTKEQELLFLRRSFIYDMGKTKTKPGKDAVWQDPKTADAGYERLVAFANKDQQHSDFLKWLLTDYETLQLYVTGGIPGGRTWLDDGAGYDRSLNQFFDLVKAHPDDLKPGVTPDADRIVYKKMMISAALGMTNNTKLWTGGGYDAADVVTRYDIIKTFRANHEKHRFQKDLFDQLSVENMRWVFENRISNEEMPWLANYTLSDALLAKVELYEQKKASKDEWKAFAKTISEKLVEYPYPMQSFLVRIEQQIKNEDITNAEIEAMRIDALRKAQKITEKDPVQWKEINDIANRLLGDKGQEMFLFSFDGVDAGVLKLGEHLSSTVPWKYSLDGGNKWVEITDHRTEVKLTEQELASITAQNDIKLQIIGINQTHTIDITEGKAPSGYELNHAERRIYTKHDKKPELIEAQVNGTWVKLSENPKLPYSGDFAIRSAATGHALASTGENAPKVHFTDAYDIEGSTVVPATEVTANAASSQHNDEEPERALDGYVGGDSFWHNRWTGDEDAYITVDLGRERTITTIDYWNKGFNHNGMLFEADLSFAGEQAGPADKPIAADKFSAPKRVKLEWDKQGEPYGARGRAYRITLDEPVTARYVRIRSIQAKIDDGSKPPLFSASELQFYERAQQVETFTFDGEAAGVLKLGTQFDASDSAWQYSLDGGAHWTDVAASESSKQLSEAELASIAAAADIQVRLAGGTKVHAIDIAEGTAPDRYFANNADRKIHVPADGSLSSLEYKQGDTWVDVSEETVFPSIRISRSVGPLRGPRPHRPRRARCGSPTTTTWRARATWRPASSR